jgi:hypothetical protein
MLRPRHRALFLIVAAAGAVPLHAQAVIDARSLATKKRFDDQQTAALAQPYVGVRTSSGVVPGLFPIRATGVSTKPIREAASAFLHALGPAQLIRTVFDVDDQEWRRWSNVDNGIYVRQGVSLKEMTPAQRTLAMALLRTSLSARGLTNVANIRKTDQALREINNDSLKYDEDLYFFTLMGVPSETEPWGWQLEGHHLVINYFVMGDQVVMTPLFMGGEPVITTTGKYAGNTILQTEQNMGVALMRALTPAQQVAATLDRNKPENNIRAQADADNLVLEYEGVRASTLSPAQKGQLLDLIGLYVGNMREDQAKVRMLDVAAHLDETYFAWVGGTSDTDVFYYRIHSPVVLIEFDHQRPVGSSRINGTAPSRAHIHVVVRTPNGNDYGKDLLRQHLLTHKH